MHAYIWEYKHILHSVYYIANNQQTSQTLCGTKQTNQHSALNSPEKNGIITQFATLCCHFAIRLTFIQNCTFPSPYLTSIRNCVRSDNVFRLWLDRSQWLKLHVARPLQFFIINLDSGFRSKKKKTKTVALDFISLFWFIWLGFEVPFYFYFRYSLWYRCHQREWTCEWVSAFAATIQNKRYNGGVSLEAITFHFSYFVILKWLLR